MTKQVPLGVGMKLLTGTYTGPASYASGGEDITSAIARAAWGVSQIHALFLTPAVNTSTGAAVSLVYDPDAGTNLGKIRAINSGLGAHTHDLSIIGGQGAAGTNTVTSPAATDLLGKQEAGDALVLGADVATKGGVVAAAAGAAGAEVTATTDLSDYVGQFVLYGV